MSEEYPSLLIEGGLISAEVLADIKEEKTPGQRGVDFSGDKDQKLLDLVSAAWGDAQERWLIFQRQVGRLTEGDAGTTITRAWMSDLLSLLGFDLVRLQHMIEQDGRKYHLSHRAGTDPNAPPVHIVGCRQSIDRRAESGPSPMAPHSMVQDFLNHSEELWGIVTNGLVFRLLRDSHLMKRQAYIEFDLEEIFTGDRFPDFYLLYRLAHASRFPRGTADTESCLLEQYHRLSIEQGGRVRNGLRNGVEQALLLLANGFLSHPENTGFAADVAAGKVDPTDLYRQLLKIIYRLLFLMVCEERGLISFDPVYKQQYSINRLRRLIHHRGAYTRHTDLWTGLVVQFKLFSDEELGSVMSVPPLNGELFADHGTALVNDLYITNDSLLNAIWNLGMYQEEIKQRRKTVKGPVRKVNYAALDVEELGSVYESLLDLQPVFLPTVSGNTAFQFSAGTERKSTGSYYTPPELVNELIKSALVPVIDDRLSGLKKKEEKENALLSISVCDPACGSGHFLLAAARRIGRELARVRSGDEEPSPEANRDAIRDVITHCIYGVDKNPLAVDLCRVALWLEGHTAGKPLTFLDHRIRCGDSLVGVHDLNILKKGIPPEAYKALTGDDKDVAKKYTSLAKDHFKATPRSSEQEKKKQEKRAKGSALVNQPLFDTSVLSQSDGEFSPQQDLVHLVAERKDLTVEDKDIKTVQCKAERFEQSRKPGTVYDHDARACNIWTAAFFAELTRDNEAANKIPTNVTLLSALSRKSGEITESKARVEYAQELAETNRFFHWPIEFPEVFSNGGFDCVLGNPPWERVKLQQEEFFSTRDPSIALAQNKAERERLIKNLKNNRKELFHEYELAVHLAEAASLFIRNSGRFPLTGRGDVNTYSVFTELFRISLSPGGRSGLICPPGIASDDTNKFFFADLMKNQHLVSLFAFVNEKFLFPGVLHNFRFCLITMTGSSLKVENPEFIYECEQVKELNQEERKFTLTYDDISLLNPNTLTAPVFRTKHDANLNKKVYQTIPVFVNENCENGNPWGISFQAMFHMSGDSALFFTRKQLEDTGFELQNNIFIKGQECYLPLYESKMVDRYDHRYGSFPPDKHIHILPQNTTSFYQNSQLSIFPFYYVNENEVLERIKEKWSKKWFFIYGRISSKSLEVSSIFSIIPLSAVSESCPIIFIPLKTTKICCLYALSCSLLFDNFARQKIPGANFSYFILKQLPILSPKKFSTKIEQLISKYVLELTYTSWDIKAFADDLWREADEPLRSLIRTQWDENTSVTGGHSWNPPEWADIADDGIPLPPFKWDEDRRAVLRAELDALYAKLYGLTYDELRYILDPQDVYGSDYPGETFRVLKEKEIRKYGEYRTRRLVLEAWERTGDI